MANPEKLILVVDDDADICASLSEILAADGYTVEVARNGEEGLAMAKKLQPRVILLDIMMPVLDGYGFLQRQRADPEISAIPVIVLSAGTRLDQLPREIPRLPKPPELLALFALIESAMRESAPKSVETPPAPIVIPPRIDAPSVHP